MEYINNDYQNCIDFLNDCVQICQECFYESLHGPDIKKRNELILSLIDCAEMCKLAVNFLERKSHHAEEMTLLSAHLAKSTAELCEKYDDEVTKLTKQVCLETASMCYETFDRDPDE